LAAASTHQAAPTRAQPDSATPRHPLHAGQQNPVERDERDDTQRMALDALLAEQLIAPDGRTYTLMITDGKSVPAAG
jgi:hypothetical protein